MREEAAKSFADRTRRIAEQCIENLRRNIKRDQRGWENRQRYYRRLRWQLSHPHKQRKRRS